MKPRTVTRLLGIGFILLGIGLTWWCVSSCWWMWTVVKSVGPRSILIGLFFFSPALVVLAGIGLLKAAGWARWLGLLLAGSVPTAHTESLLLIGTTALTPQRVCVSLGAIFVFLFLWRSRHVEQVFGHIPAKTVWGVLAAAWALPTLLLGVVIYLKAISYLPHFASTGRVVLPASQPTEPRFIQRDLADNRIAVPTNAQVMSIKRRTDWGDCVTLWTPGEKMFLSVCSKAPGELLWPGGQRFGLGSSPYEIHRQLLRPSWNALSLVLGVRVSSPYYPKLFHDAQVTELETPQWQALVVWKSEHELFHGTPYVTLRAVYAIYSRESSLQSATCSWLTRTDGLSPAQLERRMGAFKFLSAVNPWAQEVQEARTALAAGRTLDAQFALAQAYLHGPPDLAVTWKLAEVSAELGEWLMVQQLAQELLAEDPHNQEVKTLSDTARRALDKLNEEDTSEAQQAGSPPLKGAGPASRRRPSGPPGS